MTEPISLAGADFFTFISANRLAVVLVSLHSIHSFNRVLAKELDAIDESIALATIGIGDLVTAGGSTLRFVHQGLRRCGAPSAFGVLPGYYLFRSGTLVAWEAGLPTVADATAIARSALFGVVWSGVSHDASVVAHALRFAADHVAGQRMAAAFQHVLNEPDGDRETTGERDAPPVDEVFWAYQRLGVLPTATDREIHEAWRRKRRDAHPDHAGNDAAEFERRSRVSRDLNRARDIITAYRSGGARRAS